MELLRLTQSRTYQLSDMQPYVLVHTSGLCPSAENRADYPKEINYPHYNIIEQLYTSHVRTHVYFSLQISNREWPFVRKLEVENHIHKVYCTITRIDRPSLWSSGQSFWLQIRRSRVRFPALPDFLSSSGSGTGSIQPREVN